MIIKKCKFKEFSNDKFNDEFRKQYSILIIILQQVLSLLKIFNYKLSVYDLQDTTRKI